MASVKFEKGSNEWEMFLNFWQLAQKYWIPEDSDEYWEQVLESTIEFHKKYKESNNIFAKNISIALMETLNCKFKEMKS